MRMALFLDLEHTHELNKLPALKELTLESGGRQ